MRKISTKDIYNFIEGNGRILLNKYNFSSPHLQEQIAYRLLTCKNDCVKQGKCKVCKCPLPNRAFTTESCNKERFPDLMSEEDWNKYKIGYDKY